jgi:hypothetical protein
MNGTSPLEPGDHPEIDTSHELGAEGYTIYHSLELYSGPSDLSYAVIDIRTTLCYLGVPIERPTYMFGDNESVVTSATIPHSSLTERHNTLSYHRVREAVASGILKFYQLNDKDNPSDVVEDWSSDRRGCLMPRKIESSPILARECDYARGQGSLDDAPLGRDDAWLDAGPSGHCASNS